MKYGKTERISGIVILVALAVILLPWLMSEPEPREDRPEPSFTIERPIEVPRQEVAPPEQPESINLASTSSSSDESDIGSAAPVDVEPAPAPTPEPTPAPAPEPEPTPEPAPEPSPASSASGNDSAIPAASPQGDWGVQIGSFGNPDNVQRLIKELEGEGFSVFTRARNADLTAVLVGPFASSAEGERAMALVKERANYQGLLVRVRD
ncbi:SPOR domain-containing protein [Vreelandella aquamarina]